MLRELFNVEPQLEVLVAQGLNLQLIILVDFFSSFCLWCSIDVINFFCEKFTHQGLVSRI
jgi:hypothetical protein